MALVTCDICGRQIRSATSQTYNFDSKQVCMCTSCWSKFDLFRYNAPSREQTTAYFRNHLQQGSTSSLGGEFISYILQKYDPDRKKDSSKLNPADSSAPVSALSDTASSFSGSVPLIVTGCLFLLAAIILFFSSIQALDRESARVLGTEAIANIPSTIFSAANFIASVVCFVGSSIISVIRSKK